MRSCGLWFRTFISLVTYFLNGHYRSLTFVDPVIFMTRYSMLSDLAHVLYMCRGCSCRVSSGEQGTEDVNSAGIEGIIQVYVISFGYTWHYLEIYNIILVYMTCFRYIWDVSGIYEMFQVYMRSFRYVWQYLDKYMTSFRYLWHHSGIYEIIMVYMISFWYMCYHSVICDMFVTQM